MADQVIQMKNGSDNAFPKNILQYDTLINGINPTTSVTSYSLYNSRNISNYNLIFALVKRGSDVRCTFLMPRALFASGVSMNLSDVDSGNTERWYWIGYSSDTAVRIYKSANGSDVTLYLYGLYIGL